MVAVVLATVATGTCRHCGEPIELIRGGWADRWMHSGDILQATCADAPVAEPRR